MHGLVIMQDRPGRLNFIRAHGVEWASLERLFGARPHRGRRCANPLSARPGFPSRVRNEAHRCQSTNRISITATRVKITHIQSGLSGSLPFCCRSSAMRACPLPEHKARLRCRPSFLGIEGDGRRRDEPDGRDSAGCRREGTRANDTVTQREQLARAAQRLTLVWRSKQAHRLFASHTQELCDIPWELRDRRGSNRGARRK
jgi:hypothetical protein